MIDVAYVALGSNLGDRDAHLADARRELAELPGSRVVGISSVEETEPLGGLQQPWYLNQMVAHAARAADATSVDRSATWTRATRALGTADAGSRHRVLSAAVGP
jgi:2-amino-4-hydroxy-6-hydroxymethyldihydropteridine diphosphokinase